MFSKKFNIPFFLRETSWRGTLEGLCWYVLFVPILFSYIPLGFRLSMVNFTYGDGGLDPTVKARALSFFGLTLAVAYALEVVFRGLLLRFFLRRQDRSTAFWCYLLVSNLILVPFYLTKGIPSDAMGIGRFVLMENLLLAFWAVFFMRTGSLLVTAGLHGCYNFFRFVLMGDVSGAFDTFYFYSAAEDDFYWLMLAVTLVAVALQVLINRVLGCRELSLLEPLKKGTKHAV